MTHGVRVAAALAVLVAAGCSSAPRTPTPVPRAGTAPRPLTLYALQGREVRLAHVGKSTTPTVMATVVSGGKPIGDVQPLPEVLSDHHQTMLVEAETLYGKHDYAAALAALEPAYRDEPTNPFVLEAYGRALYRQLERARAFAVYRKLVDLLDAEWGTDAPTAVTIDVWFVDAYWKVGTLHVDRAEWERAAFEISRALAGGSMWERLAGDQALSYLIRAYHELGRRDVARYYAERALERNPRNLFAKRYLDPLSRDSK
ncbi:MAG TPA: BTAD domain-containing putative transcriptional regulator [Patescibacteria group bacterium]|nr:BTAD domain-containing putative transcriptional regulator [Patescibacteria group bacterium]